MIQSMTGFGAAEVNGIKAEMRSLNHRYLDITVRMPSMMLEHEIPVRNLIRERFSRGKFDITISLTGKRQQNVSINKELMKGIYNAFAEMQRELSIPGDIKIDFFSGYREALLMEDAAFSAEDLYASVKEALGRIDAMRQQEGEALGRELKGHIGLIEELSMKIKEQAGNVASRLKEQISKKVYEIASSLTIDEGRLAQEVALLAQKADIAEELARLKSHLQQFGALLSKKEAIGRKLDFILQEIMRETNTIASKSDDITVINTTIEIKSHIEKLREQAQNIQ
ncbi:MAG: YicC family protein [Nitrospirae bacterium]|nr:MAG: YicC family protein [Nitrospirota bacterium]